MIRTLLNSIHVKTDMSESILVLMLYNFPITTHRSKTLLNYKQPANNLPLS